MSEPGFGRAHPAAVWVSWLKTHFAPEGMGEGTLLAYLHHFADLGLFEASESGELLLFAEADVGAVDVVRRALAQQADKPGGFAVKAFIGQGDFDLASALKEAEAVAGAPRETRAPEPASDLSNLQIVKKVGRQLRPFLDLEKAALALLAGPLTTKADAQKIFHHLLSRTQMKAPARTWEQLSRKRHR